MIAAAHMQGFALRIVLGDGDERSRERLADQLTAYGHAVVAAADTAAEAVAQTREQCADVVLLDLRLLDGAAGTVAQLARLNPVPGVVLLTADANVSLTPAELARTGAAAVLATPVRSAVLESTARMAAAQARVLEALRRDASAARQQVEERKLVDRAKGILMRRTGLAYPDAEQLLERAGEADAATMLSVARSVLSSELRASGRGQRARDGRRGLH